MDLSTVKSKLLKGDYLTLDEFIAQIQLIWDNCKLYNMAGSVIYKICERMERSYNRELTKFKVNQGISTTGQKSTANTKVVKEKLTAAQDDAPEVISSDMKRDLC